MDARRTLRSTRRKSNTLLSESYIKDPRRADAEIPSSDPSHLRQKSGYSFSKAGFPGRRRLVEPSPSVLIPLLQAPSDCRRRRHTGHMFRTIWAMHSRCSGQLPRRSLPLTLPSVVAKPRRTVRGHSTTSGRRMPGIGATIGHAGAIERPCHCCPGTSLRSPGG